ncbi:MAG: hypothetical protein LC808_26345 [Actinobacteria bacterium]|nr:hypothetical protein [Actinomycetota bacterium]
MVNPTYLKSSEPILFGGLDSMPSFSTSSPIRTMWAVTTVTTTESTMTVRLGTRNIVLTALGGTITTEIDQTRALARPIAARAGTPATTGPNFPSSEQEEIPWLIRGSSAQR